jgi:phosphonopyruvate decarboxylase
MKCEELWKIFKKHGFTFFTGVPDSTFKQWMSFLEDHHNTELINRIAAIERDAIGWAAGYYAATGNPGVVYMQNSGFGNTINPLTSLTDPEVYNIPVLLMIGWRGEPGKYDEPQHIKMGKVTIPLLNALGIKYEFLPKNAKEAEKIIGDAKKHMATSKEPYAIVIKKGIFEDYKKKKIEKQKYEMKREDAIKAIIDNIQGNEIIVSTTGKTSRELFEYRKQKNLGHQNDFLMIGSMGLASSFGAEIALQKPEKRIFVFDGDGALIMSKGVLSTIGYYSPKNFYHILFDNASHESTGGQPTTSITIDFEKVALANNYKGAKTVKTKQELIKAIKELKNLSGPYMLVITIEKGARKDLGRTTTSPRENKKAFMGFLSR